MSVPLGTVTALMVVFAIKHFLADFLFQTQWIAKGKAATTGWLLPLMVHAGGHAVLTLAIILFVRPELWWIAPAELVLHAGIDRAKVVIGRAADMGMGKPGFWWLLGFDQLLHQLTNIAIVYGLMSMPSSAS